MIEKATLLRLSVFASVFIIMALWEIFLPRRSMRDEKKRRWVNNIGITLFNSSVVRIIAPLGATGFAFWADANNIGIFNYFNLHPFAEFAASILILDLTLFTQHFMFHHIKIFAKIHKMHHLDLDLDVTSGTRFHPIEILISLGLKGSVIIAAGCSPISALVFEIILNATAMFNHSNIYIPEQADLIIRKFIVTPDMHRVHHSIIARELNSNYGFALSIWDRLFRTYIKEPSAGQKSMVIGLQGFQELPGPGFLYLLASPFKSRKRST